MNNRDQWILNNVTKFALTTGLPNTRAVPPGKSIDLLVNNTKETVLQAKSIYNLLKRNWCTITTYTDGQPTATYTTLNLDLFFNQDAPSEPEENSSDDVSLNMNGRDLNMNNGTGIEGGNLFLDGGSLIFNNNTSINSTGPIVSVQCDDFTTAANVTVLGNLHVEGLTTLSLAPDLQPLSPSTLTFVQIGNSIVLKATNDEGKQVSITLGTFE